MTDAEELITEIEQTLHDLKSMADRLDGFPAKALIEYHETILHIGGGIFRTGDLLKQQAARLTDVH